MTRRINHVAIAVRETSAALHLYSNVLGFKADATTRVDSEGVLATFVEGQGARLEILEPIDPDTAVGRFLERRGEGLHHICLEVDDLRAVSAELAAQGYNLVDPEPRRRPSGELYVFLHPNSTNGVLVELYQAAGPDGAAPLPRGVGATGRDSARGESLDS